MLSTLRIFQIILIIIFTAHRVIPQVLVQEVKFTNMRNNPVMINVLPSGLGDWTNTQTKYIK